MGGMTGPPTVTCLLQEASPSKERSPASETFSLDILENLSCDSDAGFAAEGSFGDYDPDDFHWGDEDLFDTIAGSNATSTGASCRPSSNNNDSNAATGEQQQALPDAHVSSGATTSTNGYHAAPPTTSTSTSARSKKLASARSSTTTTTKSANSKNKKESKSNPNGKTNGRTKGSSSSNGGRSTNTNTGKTTNTTRRNASNRSGKGNYLQSQFFESHAQAQASDINKTDTDKRFLFPVKLYKILTEVCHTNKDPEAAKSICWASHGRSFKVQRVDHFEQVILPRYLKLTQLRSFYRQLNLYGYTRITSGVDAGGYYHENFLRGCPSSVYDMRRQKVKGKGENCIIFEII